MREAHDETEAELELVLTHQDQLHEHLTRVEDALDAELSADGGALDGGAMERQVRGLTVRDC